MPRRYSSVGDQTIASPTDTVLTLQAATTVRPEIFEFDVGVDAPADNQIRLTVQAFDTDDGTGTGVTPTPIDNGDPASLCTVQDNHTTEPSSYTAGEILYDNFFNQRATLRWVATPGAEWRLAAVATEGIGFLPIHASATDDIVVTLYHAE